MSNYTQHLAKAQVKAGEAAIKYCIENKLAGWYLMTKEEEGTEYVLMTKEEGTEYVESGPYTTLELAEEALKEKNNRFKFYIRLLFKDEAEAIIYYL